MTTAEERKKILTMVAEKIITPEDGVKLLSALKASDKNRKTAGGASTSFSIPRMNPNAGVLRIQVSDPTTHIVKTDVRVPLALINFGLGIGARFIPEIEDIDMSALLETINAGARGKILEVLDEEEGEYVQIFVD